MSNRITIELCAEDRARLDRLAEAMERKTCDKCVTTAIDAMKQKPEAPIKEEEVTTAPVEETPTEEVAQTEPVQTVDRGALRAKVIELSAKGFKEQTKDIVRAYAPTVSSVPEEKLSECFEKLVALEG